MGLAFKQPVDTANHGLQLLGVDQITAADFQSPVTKGGREMSRCYDALRTAELRRNTWRFATRRAILRAVDTADLVYVPIPWLATGSFATGEFTTYQGILWKATSPTSDVAEIAPAAAQVVTDIAAVAAANTALLAAVAAATTAEGAAATAKGTAATAETAFASAESTAATDEAAVASAESAANTATGPVTTDVNTLVADGASPTQAHVTTLNTDWGTFHTNWTTLDTDWGTLSTALTALSTAWTTFSGDLTTLSTDWTAYAATWATLDADWATLSADWATLSADWTILAADVAQIPVMGTAAAAIASAVTAVAGVVATIAGAVSAAAAAVTAVGADLTTLATDATTIASDMTTLATNQGSVATDVAALVTIIASVATDVGVLVSDGASPTQAHVTTLNGHYTTFGTDWSTFTGDWSTLATNWGSFATHFSTFATHWATFLTDWTAFAGDWSAFLVDWATFATPWATFLTDWAALYAIIGDVTPPLSGAWASIVPPPALPITSFQASAQPYALGVFVDYLGTIYVSLESDNLDTPPSANWLQLQGTVSTLTALWTPAVYSATTAYPSFYVVNYNGDYYQAQSGVAVGDIPDIAATWLRYFGPVTVSPYGGNLGASPVSYFAGEIASQSGQNYLSLQNGNTDVPPSSNWLAVDGALQSLVILYPLGTGPVTEVTTNNVFRLPHGFLRQCPTNPKAGITPPVGGPVYNGEDDALIEGEYMVGDNPGPMLIRFVADVIDVVSMDDMFCRGLGASMALQTCEAITQANDKKADARAEYKMVMGEARTVNGIEVGTVDPVEDEYLMARL